MYVDTATSQQHGKTYIRHLLRESYRKNGKVKHRTIANLSHCSANEIEAIRLALRHKGELEQLGSLKESIQLNQGLSVGAVWLVYGIARQLGIVNALGSTREGKLALWQIISRVIDQGSRLSAVRLAGYHAACDVLGLEKFDEDDLYDNLDWLNLHQSDIELRLHKKRFNEKPPDLFLYDVTISYLEGENNALGAFGYNRDGKKGKQQIVIGLLCDREGFPVSIEVFAGNTQDPKTFTSQIRKVAERFGGGEVTFVGDRGMLKSPQLKEIAENDNDFHYITAITKPQIEKLIKVGVLQMNLFDRHLAEVKTEEGIRYILRRNPTRAQEIKLSRESKYHSLCKAVKAQNSYLENHPRAKIEVALRKINALSHKLKIFDWVDLATHTREIKISKNTNVLLEISKLDGCYVVKTDLSNKNATKEIIHDRYKDLTLVEQAFRTSKTVHLEMRPVFVQLESRTRAHAFVVMLAYMIIKVLSSRWNSLNITVEEGIKQLSTLCMTEVKVKDKAPYNQIPKPREMIRKLFTKTNVILPNVLPSKGIIVTTKKKLPENRKLKYNQSLTKNISTI